MKKIALISLQNPCDIRSFSGILFHGLEALKKSYDTEIFYIEEYPLSIRIYGKLIHLLFADKYSIKKSIVYAWLLSNYINKKLKTNASEYEMILFFNCIQLLSFHKKKGKAKILYYSDAVFNGSEKLLIINQKEGHIVEKKGQEKADILLFSSKWSFDIAITKYQTLKSKCHILPYGANIPHIEKIPRKWESTIKMIIIGVDWYRKGIDIAIEVNNILRKKGYDSYLTIIGISKNESFLLKTDNPFINIIPFINKSRSEGINEIKNQLSNSNYFLFPTRNDYTPIVLAEAMMFGLPIVTRDTGGIKEIVLHGENGYVLSNDSTANSFSEQIIRIYKDPELYIKLSNKSRDIYETRYNWNSWIYNFDSIIEESLN